MDRLSTASGPAARSDRATGLWGRLHRMLRWQPEWSTVRLVMTFLPIVLASAGALTDYNTTRRQIEDRVSATAAMMTIYVATALDQATTSSMVVADHLGRYNLRSRPQSIVETALLADDLVRDSQSVTGILVIGRNGEIVADIRHAATEWPAGETQALLDRHAPTAAESSILISPPYIGPESHERQFNVSISNRTLGQTEFVVASTIVAEELLRRARAASPYRDYTVTLFDQNGNVLARHPSIGDNLTQIDRDRMPTASMIASLGENRVHVGRLQFSPGLRIINTTAVPGFPVYVALSVSYWEAYSFWLRRSFIVVVTALAAGALLYLAIGQLIESSRREVEAERSLRDAVDRERKAEIVAIRNQDREVIARMAGGVGHEFNNLMAGVLGIGEALARHPVAADQASRFGRALTQTAERGGTLSHALMIYAGKGFLDFKVVDLADVVSSSIAAFQTTVGPDTAIALSAPPGPLHARIDPDKLAIAIGHLLTNAVEALPDRRGRIDVILEADRPLPAGVTLPQGRVPTVAISIVDNGSGMTPDILARARDPFFTTREIGQGAGLGLSMVDGLVQASGGQLHLDSTVGVGTRVTLWLPRTGTDGNPLTA